jgi:chromosome segregation ATPase
VTSIRLELDQVNTKAKSAETQLATSQLKLANLEEQLTAQVQEKERVVHKLGVANAERVKLQESNEKQRELIQKVQLCIVSVVVWCVR